MLLNFSIRSISGLLVLGLLLFVPAGTLAWPEAWALLAIFGGCGLAIGLWLARTDPELLVERMKSPLSRTQRPRDRWVVAAMVLAFCAWLVSMALDARRLAGAHRPMAVSVVGAVLVIGAFAGWASVLRVNRFAAITVELQTQRGQYVVTTGPYAIVRHPMYAYVLLLVIGIPLLLGSWWGLAGALVLVVLLVARTLGEEALLLQGLAGYRDYSARVRYRLLPGLW